MHVHATQVNPYAALDALRSAQKAESRREAELVRKELLDSASELAGEPELSDACVVKLEARQESQRQSRRRNQKRERNQASDAESSASEEDDASHLSDWA
jgi:hypothetical protein